MKIYELNIVREYTTTINFTFPDDGRNHAKILDKAVLNNDAEIWDQIAEEELEQMNVSNESWNINEIINKTEKATDEQILSAFNKITNLKIT